MPYPACAALSALGFPRAADAHALADAGRGGVNHAGRPFRFVFEPVTILCFFGRSKATVPPPFPRERG